MRSADDQTIAKDVRLHFISCRDNFEISNLQENFRRGFAKRSLRELEALEMGFDDLIDFDEAAYAQKVRQLPTAELKARETQKSRQFLAGSASLGLSLGALPATGGISLVFAATSARKMDIAKRKLEIVIAELQRRSVPLKSGLSTRDIVIPAIGGVVAMGVGTGVEGHMGGDTVMQGDIAGGVTTEQTASFGELAVANAIASRAAESSTWVMTQFDTKSWVGAIRANLGCSRLAGGPDPSPWTCDSCDAKIEKGMFARAFS
jgi:hypothetical protein